MGLQHRLLQGAMKGALRLIYPPQCLGCAATVGSGGDDGADLCADCWRETRFVTGACCMRCGAPQPDDGAAARDDDITCDDCLMIARPWQAGRAAMVYSGTGRRLVLALKHADRPELAPPMAGWLARAAAPLIQPDMVVVPVPLHLRRLLKRRYNQAALVAGHVARAHKLTHLPTLLRRTRYTEMQDHRSVGDRFANMRDAIAADPRQMARIAGRPVLLIDDVMTSGATLSAATQALQMAGAGQISVAVLARVVKDD